jgi:hypothetical protein
MSPSVSIATSRWRLSRLSPSRREEDDGEGFEHTRPESTLTFPLYLEKGEVTPFARRRTGLQERT